MQIRVKIEETQWSARWRDTKLDHWFHIVGIWDNMNGLSLYVDGCIVRHSTTPLTVVFTNDNRINELLLGRVNNVIPAGYGSVTLDEFYMYEYAITESIVPAIYWYYFIDDWFNSLAHERCGSNSNI